MAVEAGKDAYVEKPMGNVLSEAKAARDAVFNPRASFRLGRNIAASPISKPRRKSRAVVRSAT